MQQLSENTGQAAENDQKRFSDKRTDDRIREHLTNERDNISAEDISNVQSNISSPAAANSETDDEKVIEKKDNTEYEGKDDEANDKPEDITPWNVID